MTVPLEPATREIRIETSTVCNYRCRMCARDQLTRACELMDDALFEDIVARSRRELRGLQQCTVSGFGELAADPHWANKLAIARSAFDRVHAVTNLSLIEDAELVRLAELTTEVRVSLCGADSARYRATHRPPAGIDLAMIEQRVRRLAARRSPAFQLILTCSVLDDGAWLEEWVSRWTGVADRLEAWRPHNWIDVHRYRERSGPRLASCGRPAAGPLQVQVDGTMNVCCFDYDGKMLIGDLRRQSFSEILGGEPLARIRALHREGRADELPLCAGCDQREAPQTKQQHLLHCSDAAAAERVLRTSSAGETLSVRQAGTV